MSRQPDLIEDTKGALAKLTISAKTGENLDKLNDWVESWALSELNLKETGGSLNVRQGELCLRSLESLKL
ncbi:hypothetical protein ABTL48_20520, partial [Acinetobacter baumannii]